MSIATEITRLQTAKADLKTAIEGKGVTVPSATLIDGYADLVDAIQTGGGGGSKYDDLVDVINGTFTGTEFTNEDITIARNSMFSNQRIRNVQRLSLPNCTTVEQNGIYQAYSLKSVYLPKVTRLGVTAMGYCNNTGFDILVLPSLTQMGAQAIRNMTALVTLDVLGGTSSGAWGGNAMVACTKLSTVVIRQTDAVSPLDNINSFNDTCFASGKAGGTLYVPSALIADYQAATNWSTILGYTNNSIAAIEGSQYENYYADGTPIT